MSAMIEEKPEKISGWCCSLNQIVSHLFFFFPSLSTNLFLISCSTVACQTTLSLPLAFDLEKVLGKN